MGDTLDYLEGFCVCCEYDLIHGCKWDYCSEECPYGVSASDEEELGDVSDEE